jgi:hypothetical protein
VEGVPPISVETGSDEAVACVRRWLDRCINDHKKCLDHVRDMLPTRLLRLYGPEDVKLHITADELVPYVCLSHCWGGHNILTTRSDNLDRFCVQNLWYDLPLTFQDAISFAYRLGFEYIWIDSLCIVQNSDADWRHEGSRMASIYQNAALTIAATRAQNSAEGCFAMAHPQHQSHKWQISSMDEIPYDIHTRIPLDHSAFMYWNLPLSQRAWAFQERLLSPRMIHFTDHEIVWECSEQIDCECSAIRALEWKSTMNNTTVLPKGWRNLPMQLADHQWLDIVSSFTAKSMSFSKDVFPALQGLAKMMPTSMGPYVAGLWTNTLLENLTWYLPFSGALERPEIWRAPSWSWASTSGDISWSRKDHRAEHRVEQLDFKTRIELVDVRVSPLGEDAMGEISSGALVIEGRALPGRIHYDESDIWVGQLCRVRFSEDGFIFHSESLDEVRHERELSGSSLAWDYPITWEGANQVPDGSNVLVVQIEDEKPGKTHGRSTSIWLILRVNHVGDYSDVYERIGLLTLYEPSSGYETRQEDDRDEPIPSPPENGLHEGDLPDDSIAEILLIRSPRPINLVLRALEDSPPRQITIL